MVSCEDCGRDNFTEHGLEVHKGMSDDCGDEFLCERCGEPMGARGKHGKRQCSDCFQEHGWLDDTIKRNRASNIETWSTKSHPLENVTGEEHPAHGHRGVAPTGEDHPLYGVTGDDHPTYGHRVTFGKSACVVPTQHRVRSLWEAEIALILYDNDYAYEYEKPYELEHGTWRPDFTLDDCVVEVKGIVTDTSVKKAKEFIDSYDHTLIVVGVEYPADIHIPWDDRESLPGKLNTLSDI